MEVALGSNHSATMFSVLDKFHFAKLLTVCRHLVQQRMTTVAAILYPTALPMIEIEPSHPVHHNKGWRQGDHQRPGGRSSYRKLGEGCRKSGVAAALPDASGHEKLYSGFSCKFHLRSAIY